MRHIVYEYICVAINKDASMDKASDMATQFVKHKNIQKICKDTRLSGSAKVDEIYKILTPYLRKSGVKKYKG